MGLHFSLCMSVDNTIFRIIWQISAQMCINAAAIKFNDLF